MQSKGKTNCLITFALGSKVGFFFKSKSWCDSSPWLAFLAEFSGILQLKNTEVHLSGSQKLHISSFRRWVWPIVAWENEEQPGVLKILTQNIIIIHCIQKQLVQIELCAGGWFLKVRSTTSTCLVKSCFLTKAFKTTSS